MGPESVYVSGKLAHTDIQPTHKAGQTTELYIKF